MAQFLYNANISVTLGAAENNTTITLNLGKTTIVLVTLTQNVAIQGITTTGGTNVDGAVVTLQNVTGSFTLSGAHETGSPTSSMLRNSGLTTVTTGTGYGALTYRYDGSRSRWMQLGR